MYRSFDSWQVANGTLAQCRPGALAKVLSQPSTGMIGAWEWQKAQSITLIELAMAGRVGSGWRANDGACIATSYSQRRSAHSAHRAWLASALTNRPIVSSPACVTSTESGRRRSHNSGERVLSSALRRWVVLGPLTPGAHAEVSDS